MCFVKQLKYLTFTAVLESVVVDSVSQMSASVSAVVCVEGVLYSDHQTSPCQLNVCVITVTDQRFISSCGSLPCFGCCSRVAAAAQCFSSSPERRFDSEDL